MNRNHTPSRSSALTTPESDDRREYPGHTVANPRRIRLDADGRPSTAPTANSSRD